jgi:tetratricopeptide (TPR) repeat protein
MTVRALTVRWHFMLVITLLATAARVPRNLCGNFLALEAVKIVDIPNLPVGSSILDLDRVTSAGQRTWINSSLINTSTVECQSPSAWRARAWAQFASGDSIRAADSIRRVIGQPDTQVDDYALALSIGIAADDEYLVADLLEGLTDSAVLDALGRLAEKRDKYDLAKEFYRSALRFAPDNITVAVRFGELLVSSGQYTQALTVINQTMLYDPDNAELRFVMAHALAAQGHYAESIPLINKLLIDEPSYSLAFVLLGEAQFKVGDLRASTDASRRALELDPNNLWAMYWLGRSLYQSGLKSEAVFWWNKSLEIDPTFKPSQDIMGGP